MAGPEPTTPLNKETSNQNSKSIIEGHVSALKELLKESSNQNLIKPMLLDFDKIQEENCRVLIARPQNANKCQNIRWNGGSRGSHRPFRGDRKSRRVANAGMVQNVPTNPRRQGKGMAYDKDLTKISKIAQRANETLLHFKERWVSESNVIPNVPDLMQISSFMSSHKCPELAKFFSDSIPKTVDDILKKAVLTLESLSSTPQEILATEHQLHLPQPAPLVGVPSKENLNRYCDYHNEKGHSTNDCFHLKRQLEIALESGKLNYLIKDVRQRGKGGQRNNGPHKAKVINMVQSHTLDQKRKTIMIDEGWMNVPITFPPVSARDLSEEALVVEAEVEGYLVRRIHIDEGALVEIMFEHCFNMLYPLIQSSTPWLKTAQDNSFYHSRDDEIPNPLGSGNGGIPDSRSVGVQK
ncbi:hypothetical protein Tco_0151287 [Tanacetum coccineum]